MCAWVTLAGVILLVDAAVVDPGGKITINPCGACTAIAETMYGRMRLLGERSGKDELGEVATEEVICC
jgi:hypothetical protein